VACISCGEDVQYGHLKHHREKECQKRSVKVASNCGNHLPNYVQLLCAVFNKQYCKVGNIKIRSQHSLGFKKIQCTYNYSIL